MCVVCSRMVICITQHLLSGSEFRRKFHIYGVILVFNNWEGDQQQALRRSSGVSRGYQSTVFLFGVSILVIQTEHVAPETRYGLLSSRTVRCGGQKSAGVNQWTFLLNAPLFLLSIAAFRNDDSLRANKIMTTLMRWSKIAVMRVGRGTFLNIRII